MYPLGAKWKNEKSCVLATMNALVSSVIPLPEVSIPLVPYPDLICRGFDEGHRAGQWNFQDI